MPSKSSGVTSARSIPLTSRARAENSRAVSDSRGEAARSTGSCEVLDVAAEVEYAECSLVVVGLGGRGDSGAQPFDLRVAFGELLILLCDLAVPLGDRASRVLLLLGEFLHIAGAERRALLRDRRVECRAERCSLRERGVVLHDPDDDVEEISQRSGRKRHTTRRAGIRRRVRATARLRPIAWCTDRPVAGSL